MSAKSLHAQIMNLQTSGDETCSWANSREAYRAGHRDARHAAAELVLAQPAVSADNMTPLPPHPMPELYVWTAEEIALIHAYAQAHAAAQCAVLAEALEALANEANGIAEMARPSIGNTNVAVLLTRITEARAALAAHKGGL